MILAVMKAIYGILYIDAWKSKDLNGVWPVISRYPLRRSNQLSYEATDVGSWSFVDPKEPVRNAMWSHNMKYYIYWTGDVKSSELLYLHLWKQFMQFLI